ncbi:MAG: hypothetical protein NC931_05965 [Candidatus Omnitrophica bacterium]|nr:hypothetical protein [Candidatus Omnitrophota bacterium]
MEQKKDGSEEEKPVSRHGYYSIVNISPRVQAGKPVTITIKAFDTQGKIYESNEKLRIIDLTQTVEPSEVFLQKGIADIMVVFKKVHSCNVLTVIDSQGRWNSSNEFVVEPNQVSTIQVIPPGLIYAGDVVYFKVILRDAYDNVVSKEGIRITVLAAGQADYPVDVISDATGKVDVPIMFRKAGETKITFSVKGTLIKESCTVKVQPGPIDRFEISEIKSPVEAGRAFSITIKAVDKYGNRTKGFLFSVDKGIPVYVQEDMSSGIWMESIKFEKATSETFIEVNDGMGHTGRSNLFSIVPSYPAQMVLHAENLVTIEGEESLIEFSVFDRYGNSISGLESKFFVDGVTEYKITGSHDRYVLAAKFNQPGKKNVKIFLKPDNREQMSVEFFMDVLPKKTVLKQKGE